MKEPLTKLRGKIDTLDHQLVKLFCQRMDIVKEIAAYKQQEGLPTLDAGRERALLARVGEQAGEELADYTESIFRAIMSASRSYQHQCSQLPSPIYQRIQQALEETPAVLPPRTTVACQGMEGCYAQLACGSLFKSPTILYFDTVQRVVQAVERGLCAYGILPIEHSTAGSLNLIYDLLSEYGCFLVAGVRLSIHYSLLGHYGTKMEEIQELFVPQQALEPCAAWLSKLAHQQPVQITVVDHEAMAAQRVAQAPGRTWAALSSQFCGEEYGLQVLEENLQDQEGYTRFLAIAKGPEIYPGADRTSLMLSLPHRPGGLHRVLSIFDALSINLRKLESRPTGRQDFTFRFYVDFECSVHAPELEKLVRDLEAECDGLCYLGTYHEVMG